MQARLVVIDPASTFLACNPNSERSVRQALRPLGDFARRARLSVLLVRHLTKASARTALAQAGGSIAWGANARAAWRAVPDPAAGDPHRHVLLPVKNNLAAAPALSYRTVQAGGQVGVEWLGTSAAAATELGGKGHEDQGKLQEASEVLFLILRGGPLPAKEVIDKARYEGVPKRTLERAKYVLGIKSERKLSTWCWHWVWRLPEQANSALQALAQKYLALDGAGAAAPPAAGAGPPAEPGPA